MTNLMSDKIDAFLKEQFFEDWMDNDDWEEFLKELEKQTGVTKESLLNDLEIGKKNGYPIEEQFNFVRSILKNRK